MGLFSSSGTAALCAALEVTRLLGQPHQHFPALLRISDRQIKWQPVDRLPAHQIQTLRVHPDERPVPALFFNNFVP